MLGTSLFPVWLPVGQVCTCILAVVPMSVALTLVRLPMNWIGLLSAIAMGVTVYRERARPGCGQDAIARPICRARADPAKSTGVDGLNLAERRADSLRPNTTAVNRWARGSLRGGCLNGGAMLVR